MRGEFKVHMVDVQVEKASYVMKPGADAALSPHIF